MLLYIWDKIGKSTSTSNIYIWEQIIQHYIYWNDWLKIEKQPLIWDNLQAEV